MSAHVEVALDYAARGWLVFPIGERSKVPLAGTRGFHDATTELAQIRLWWAEHPDANVAIATGGKSGVLVLDIDPRNGGSETLEALERELGPLPEAATVETGGGGVHYYFTAPAGVVVGKLGPGLDVKYEGGYVVAPPSVHPSGGVYDWRGECAPHEIAPATLPDSWLAALRPPKREDASADPMPVCDIPAEVREDRARRYVARMRPAISGQAGHAALWSVAVAVVRGMMLPPDRALAVLRDYSARCQPPWNDRELAHKLEDAQRARVPWGYLLHAERASSTPRDDVAPPGPEDDCGGDRPRDPAGHVPPAAPGILARDVRRERVRWLWSGRIAVGKVTIVSGDPDRGKTTVMLDVGSRVTHGRLMPDGTPGLGEPTGVVIISAEDDAGDTLRPRLEAADADLSRVLILRMHELPTIPDELGVIEAAVERVNAKVVIVDPMMAVLGDHIDAHRDHHIRRALTPLAELASRLQVAIVLIRHLNKSQTTTNAQYRGGGSIGITAAARSELLVAPDPDDETGERRVLARVKGNLAAPVPSLTYRLVPRELAPLEDDEDQSPHWTVAVEWLGQSERTADQLLVQPDAPEDRSAVGGAEQYLAQVLADGPRSSREVHSGAQAAGISRPTLWRAKQHAGVRARRAPWGDWYWSLPDSGDNYHPADPPPTAADERREAEETAAARLGALVAVADPPIIRRRAEDDLLQAAGIGQRRARDLISRLDGVLWHVVVGGGRGQQTVLLPRAETSPAPVSASRGRRGETTGGEVSGAPDDAAKNQDEPLFRRNGHSAETSPPPTSPADRGRADTPAGEVSATGEGVDL